MLDEEKILYVPKIEPERHYESSGDFENIAINLPTPQLKKEKRDNEPAKLKEAFNVLEKAFTNVVPEDIRFIGGSIIKPLSKRLDVISPDGKRHYSSEKEPESYTPEHVDTIDTSHIEEPVNTSKTLSLFPTPLNIKLNLETPQTIIQIIQSDYEKDQLNLDEYYQSKVQLILQNYLQSMLSIMAEAGIGDIENLTMKFDGDAVSVPSGKGLEHCRDYIIRSQIEREQRTNLFKKTHKTDNTMAHLRAWQAAEKQRERYYQEEYGDSGTYVESHSNALLREQRSQYNERYKSAAYAMYKYLDSSIQLVGDTLDMITKEAQAKAHLINNDVNIFASSDTKTSATLSETKKTSEETPATKQDPNEPSDKKDENHSHGKAPNGKYYSNNDWNYLKNSGLNDEQIKTVLDLDAKYIKSNVTDSNKDSETSNNKDTKKKGNVSSEAIEKAKEITMHTKNK